MKRAFIVGCGGVGKSTLATRLAGMLLDGVVISAGGWARKQFPDTPVGALTIAAMEALRSDPNRTIYWVQTYPTEGWQVIEGVRNPRDLALLSNPARDVVVRLHAPDELPATEWERLGLEAVDAYLAFAKLTWQMKVMDVVRVGDVYHPGIEQLLDFVRSA